MCDMKSPGLSVVRSKGLWLWARGIGAQLRLPTVSCLLIDLITRPFMQQVLTEIRLVLRRFSGVWVRGLRKMMLTTAQRCACRMSPCVLTVLSVAVRNPDCLAQHQMIRVLTEL